MSSRKLARQQTDAARQQVVPVLACLALRAHLELVAVEAGVGLEVVGLEVEARRLESAEVVLAADDFEAEKGVELAASAVRVLDGVDDLEGRSVKELDCGYSATYFLVEDDVGCVRKKPEAGGSSVVDGERRRC